MQLFLHIDIIVHWFFLITSFFQSYTTAVYRYIKLLKFMKHGLSTVEAQNWGFYKHAQAQPKKGVAYKKKCLLCWNLVIDFISDA